MNDNLISAIQTFTLEARALLEREAEEQLQGLYGWLTDGKFSDATKYPAIRKLDEARETREKLELYAEDEKSAGFDAKASRKKLIRETAFTWLNRIVAFRLLEERKLLKQTIAKLDKSNGFIFWLTADGNEENYTLQQRGALPANEMGEGPSDVAYRRYLIWQCGELARDVSVLFDPATLSSRLCPRPAALKQLVTNMTEELLAEAWQVGNEETIGWIYQAFNAEELQAAFAGAREQGKKFEPADIPAVTQLFTIRWVVRFLVENTLGRLWVKMHPDSRLKDSLGNLVPVDSPDPSLMKPVREITFLDPCCGSMHFGLVAFDLYHEMYKEELERAGQPGWPTKPSVASEDEISGSIVEHNIHGIDLDLRAVQLSALTLFLRARTMNPQCAFSDRNLACANVEEITGGRLDEFIKEAEFGHPIYSRILRTLAARLKDSNNLGSLLRLELEIEKLIADERKKTEHNKQFLIAFPGASTEQFDTQAGVEEFFDVLAQQILRHLNAFVAKTRSEGRDASHFVHETAKGLNYLRLVEQRYDVVTTNPPYLSGRKMNKRLATLMAEEYSDGKGDLYAAFIIRCEELLNDTGLMGMLTMHSFMFISSYEELRARLRGQIGIEVLSHYGGGLFAVGNPGTLQTTAFVFRREVDAKRRDESVGMYFRLVKEPDAESKQLAFESAIAARRAGQAHPQVFRYTQKDFDAIPGKPWVYWLPKAIHDVFQKFPLIQSFAKPRQGLATADNDRFVRKWWEVGVSRIAFGCKNRSEAKATAKKWFPYMKGGTPIPWYGNQEHVVNWERDGAEIDAFKPRAVIRNPDYYFRRGVTWSLISSKGFAARLSPGGFVFDVAGMTCFPPEKSMNSVLAAMNSQIARAILSALNPTINFQIGDIERLPVPAEANSETAAQVEECLELARQRSRELEITWEFVNPLQDVTAIKKRNEELHRLGEQVNKDVAGLYGIDDKTLESINEEAVGTSAQAVSDEGDSSEAEAGGEGSESITPAIWAQNWLSYAIGAAFGRFAIGAKNGLGCGHFDKATAEAIGPLVAADGILTTDPGQPRDLASRSVRILECMLGVDEARKRIATALGNGDPVDLVRKWLERLSGQPAASFWKYHHQMYRKRPVYWPLQSPKGQFTVWVFHEKLTDNTLYDVRGIVEERLNLADRQITDKRTEAATNKRAAKELDTLLEFVDDLREFLKRISDIIQRGYCPHIDDGVLLNAAPLHSILPSWPETKKAWDELEAGEYDWAQQAMEYWPDRVKEKCKSNKSFAIAHGLA